MKNIKYAILIDDYAPVNKFHDIIIRTSKLIDEYTIFNSALDALEHFKTDKRIPEVILLDINMPKMNGWEFLEEYSKLGEDYQQANVVMLTTSISSYDLKLSDENPLVRDFIKKPLTIVRLKEVIENLEVEQLSNVSLNA